MPDSITDPLSALAHDISRTGDYAALTVTTSTTAAAIRLLGGVTPEQLLTVPIVSFPHAAALLGGLWLWHDALPESHEIVQKNPRDLRPATTNGQSTGSKLSLAVRSPADFSALLTPRQVDDATVTLAFWHAILHRREGDFSNSKYWYHRAAEHLVLPSIGVAVAAAVNHLPADKSILRLIRTGWHPDAFVDLVEEVANRPTDPRRETIIAIQRIEWRALFDHCTRWATQSS